MKRIKEVLEDKETQADFFFNLPDEKGKSLIESSTLSPGVCYTAINEEVNNTLVKIGVVTIKGSDKINIIGTSSQDVEENIKNTFNYLIANKKSILNEQHTLSGYDLNIQISNKLGVSISGGISSAVYVAIISASYKKNLKTGLAVLGNSQMLLQKEVLNE